MYTSTCLMAFVVGFQKSSYTSMKEAASGSHVVAQKSFMKSVKQDGQRWRKFFAGVIVSLSVSSMFSSQQILVSFPLAYHGHSSSTSWYTSLSGSTERAGVLS